MAAGSGPVSDAPVWETWDSVFLKTTTLGHEIIRVETNGWVHYPWETIDPGGTLYRHALGGG